MAKAAYPTIGIAALVMFGIVYFIGCLRYSTIPTILAIGLFIFFILKTPYCTYIEKETIIVKQV